jgi:hypothetical protein
MGKMINLISIFLLVIMASLAPNASAKSEDLAYVQNPEECSINYDVLEEAIHVEAKMAVDFFPLDWPISFPFHLSLTPQHVTTELLRPPLV